MEPRESSIKQRIDAPGGGVDVLELHLPQPFPVQRIYWLRDTPDGGTRGLHAHQAVRQFLIVMAGALTVTLDDGHRKSIHRLSEAAPTLPIEPFRWLELTNFATGTVVMVLASEPHDPDDYIHDYAEFLRLVHGA